MKKQDRVRTHRLGKIVTHEVADVPVFPAVEDGDQTLTVHQLHGEVGDALVAADGVDRHDARMTEAGVRGSG